VIPPACVSCIHTPGRVSKSLDSRLRHQHGSRVCGPETSATSTSERKNSSEFSILFRDQWEYGYDTCQSRLTRVGGGPPPNVLSNSRWTSTGIIYHHPRAPPRNQLLLSRPQNGAKSLHAAGSRSTAHRKSASALPDRTRHLIYDGRNAPSCLTVPRLKACSCRPLQLAGLSLGSFNRGLAIRSGRRGRKWLNLSEHAWRIDVADAPFPLKPAASLRPDFHCGRLIQSFQHADRARFRDEIRSARLVRFVYATLQANTIQTALQQRRSNGAWEPSS